MRLYVCLLSTVTLSPCGHISGLPTSVFVRGAQARGTETYPLGVGRMGSVALEAKPPDRHILLYHTMADYGSLI